MYVYFLSFFSCPKLMNLVIVFQPEFLISGDIAALIYLCNPFTIVACVGLSTSPIENMAVILCLYGACSRKRFLKGRNVLPDS